MQTERLKAYIEGLSCLGESIAYRRHPTHGAMFLLTQFGMKNELVTLKMTFADDPKLVATWNTVLARLVAQGRLQRGPEPQSWTLPGTTFAHQVDLPPGMEPVRGPIIRLRADARTQMTHYAPPATHADVLRCLELAEERTKPKARPTPRPALQLTL
jgi:hypothetical protein